MDETASLKPRSRQTTRAPFCVKLSSQTGPQPPFAKTSSRPATWLVPEGINRTRPLSRLPPPLPVPTVLVH